MPTPDRVLISPHDELGSEQPQNAHRTFPSACQGSRDGAEPPAEMWLLQPPSPAQAGLTPLTWACSSCGDAGASPFQGMQWGEFSMQGKMCGENIALRNGSVL